MAHLSPAHLLILAELKERQEHHYTQPEPAHRGGGGRQREPDVLRHCLPPPRLSTSWLPASQEAEVPCHLPDPPPLCPSLPPSPLSLFPKLTGIHLPLLGLQLCTAPSSPFPALTIRDRAVPLHCYPSFLPAQPSLHCSSHDCPRAGEQGTG